MIILSVQIHFSIQHESPLYSLVSQTHVSPHTLRLAPTQTDELGYLSTHFQLNPSHGIIFTLVHSFSHCILFG